MVQVGDPTNTGKGGESIWGGKFNDEIKVIYFDKKLLSTKNCLMFTIISTILPLVLIPKLSCLLSLSLVSKSIRSPLSLTKFPKLECENVIFIL